MPETEVAVWFNLDGPPRFFRCEHGEGKSPWQVTQHNGVDLLMIRTKEGSHVRHAIPLENVLYWTIAPAPHGSQLDESADAKHLYCVTCSQNLVSVDGALGYHAGHLVRRFCCDSNVNDDHLDGCPNAGHPAGKGQFVGGDPRILKTNVRDFLTVDNPAKSNHGRHR